MLSNGSSFFALVKSTRYFVKIPAVQALLIQFISFFFVFTLLAGIGLLFEMHNSVILVSLLQGAVAMLLSYRRQMAPWWWLMQFIFPCALVLTLALKIPPVFFLSAFIFLLGFFWTTFRTQVPFYPSSVKVWESIEKLLPHGKQIRMIDIGSGLGGVILHLAVRHPESTFIGIELAPLPWLLSALRAAFGKSSARFIRGNYIHRSLTNYDVVFAYLSPVAMSALWQKAVHEMKPGALLLSYEFLIPEAHPSITISSKSGGPNLYGWHL
ncbi:MAG: class I SAM-dependent methyltransferase [Glaciimonas sp.]|nr:class I SAM-dependent methyltransferase [Glaciimonas sp.]